MAKHRTYSIEFKRQVAQEYLGGETLQGLARRHDVSRTRQDRLSATRSNRQLSGWILPPLVLRAVGAH